MKTTERIDTLIAGLRSKDGMQRERARHALVAIGKTAAPFLIGLLTDPSDRVRWEACKALVSIKAPAAAIPLVAALGDKSSEVRWLAAKALIAIKRKAVVPLLQTLEEHFDSPEVRRGAHHVLNALAKQKLLNQDNLAVLAKLSYLEPYSSVAWAAQKALNLIRKPGSSFQKASQRALKVT
ncbi:HEAT repeat domain-containing protein [bacterium]|nr:HEAT repeat domain-containing protein [bacterium]